MSTQDNHPIVVVGAGPVGLAAAAHLAERGLDFLVLEAGTGPAAAMASWGHVRVFSPWRFNLDHAARRLLEADGWIAPNLEDLPLGSQIVTDYLEPLTKLPALAGRVRYGAKVVAISRDGLDRVRTTGRDIAPFLIRLADGTELTASAVVDASGTWPTPNVLGGSGLPAHGEPEAAAFIETALPDVLGADRERFAGRRTLVVGAGHSAANTLLALAQLASEVPGTTVSWAIRTGAATRTYGGGDADALPARGALGSRVRALVESGAITLHSGFSVRAVAIDGGQVTVTSRSGASVTADRIVSATGFRPDHTIASELRLDLDPIMGSTRALAPLIDPNQHSCGTVPPHGVDELTQPEANYFAVGAKSYGRAPTFLMATGYEQVRSVVAALAGDWDAARDVQLELPETGVCSSSAALGADDEASCCGTPEPADVSAARGLATGIAGGLLTLPVVQAVTTEAKTSGGCCGS
ncbi:FAD-dependent oxidoreductase [Catellatospora coxensis]|uniref:Flavoprotein n=1 Tax=Catellatospora coxensis TaxID=310354 RepID=A0A8J3P4F8_9ACTN|nr:FAD-dependent oxidoreductase [Catellatospora coxensis]GIG03783.1 flavoprotein [Catellatospora coxensis]